MRVTRRKLLLVWAVSMGGAVSVFAAEPSLLAIASTNTPVAVYCPTGDAALIKAAEWCRNYLRDRGFPADLAGTAAESNRNLWALETSPNCSFARAHGLAVEKVAQARGDASLLSAFATNGHTRVSIVGKDAAGVKSGIARLVASMGDHRGELVLAQGSRLHEPFFPIRELVVANRGVVLQGTPHAETLWRDWPDTRIRAYAEQIQLMGFNSVQVCEGRSFRITPESESRALEVAKRLFVLLDAAHENGLKTSQLLWGQAPFNRKMCWSAPESRSVMEQEFRWMARTFGSRIDHVVMHMRDPGGCACGKCDDYRVPQEIAAFVLSEYRKHNPNVTVTLSTWFNQTFWAYAPGPRFLSETSVQFWTGDPQRPFRDTNAVRMLPQPGIKFLDETYCPGEIGIALHKWYNGEKARLALRAGRAVDIWSWYLSDQETTTDMSFCMQRVNYYFDSLAQHASEDIRRISTELCFHGWPQVINAYVSGQKMWTPHRNLGEIEREFCSAIFGQENATAAVEVYAACELTVNPKRGDTCLPSLDQVFGNPDYNRRFRQALAAANTVRIDASRVPRMTTTTAPARLWDTLVNHLKMISVVSEAQEQLINARRAGADRAQLDEICSRAEKDSAPFANDLLLPSLMSKLKRTAEAPNGKPNRGS